MDKDIKPHNIRFYCRTCLSQLTSSRYDVDDMPRSIFQLFKQCSGYKKNLKAFYPKSICNNCYEILKNYEELQMTSKKSAQFLEELLKPHIQTKTSPVKSNDPKGFEETEVSFLSPDVGQVALNNVEKIEDPLLCCGYKSDTDQLDTKNITCTVFKVEVKEADHSINVTPEPRKDDSTVEPMLKKNKTDYNMKRKKGFTCNVCKKTYASSSSLSMHKRLHNTEHSFKCDQCNRGFNKRYRLTNHMRSIHGVSPPARTTLINLKHENEQEPKVSQAVTNKTITVLQNEENTSKETDIKTETEQNFEIDQASSAIEIDFSNINKMCKICHKSFSSTAGVRLHMRTHEDTPRFQCDKCSRGFDKNSRLTRHMEEVHAENPIEIVCKYGCGKVFQRNATELAHYRLKHNLPAKSKTRNVYTHICEECGKVCKNSWILKEHHYQHVPLEECPYQCQQCNKRFRTRKHLQHHLMRHAGNKKFECPHCGMKKYTPHELRVHMNYHTKEIQHYCSVCNKAFNNAANKRLHEQVVHQGIKKFKCRFCEESFGKAETLKHHEMRHTGERPHKCSYCERSFIQAVALKAHLKVHEKSSKLCGSNKLTQNQLDLSEVQYS